jgi:hypothetical protein
VFASLSPPGLPPLRELDFNAGGISHRHCGRDRRQTP